jgi:hypothetical protein
VRDGAAEGAGGGPLGIDMDPLRVVCRAGELVDALLRDRKPASRTELRADEVGQRHRPNSSGLAYVRS